MRTQQASKATGHPLETRNAEGGDAISIGYQNRTKPHNPQHTPTHTQGTARNAPCCRWTPPPPPPRHLRAAGGTARTPPPPPARTTSHCVHHLQLRRRRLRSAAPALRQPLHWIRCSRSRRRSGAPRRGSGGGGLGFGFWAAGLCKGRRRRRRRRRGGGGGTAREGGGGEESDRDGSAVNAMAAMALSVFPLSVRPATGWPLWSLSGGVGGLLSTLSLSLT